MLRNIPAILSPELLKILMEMGHGDEIVLADGNFPSAACAQRLVRCDGHGVPELLEAILQLFPLDIDYSPYPVALMQLTPGDSYQPDIWETYDQVFAACPDGKPPIEQVERFAFYERAKKAFAVVATGESALYANLILKKGVVK